MNKEKKLIVRRLVAGILLLTYSAWLIFNSFKMVKVEIGLEKDEAILGQHFNNAIVWNNIFIEWMLIAIAIAIGIIYLVFSNKCPIKWLEYSMITVAIVGMVIFTIVEPSQNYEQYIFIVLIALGAPLKNGFKDMPFIDQKQIVNKKLQKPNKTKIIYNN
ncbi:MAG: hypothetical protein ABF755_00895 [Oenococcus oeni]